MSTPRSSPVTADPTKPDACRLVAPTTFNTLNAWATGITNSSPLATLCAALSNRTPTVATPFAKHDFVGHPAWWASIAVLRDAGVHIIDPATGAGRAEPIEAGSGGQIADAFEWAWALDILEQ